MEDNETGVGYTGPEIHTLNIFANPLIKNRPDPTDKNVRLVKPGEKIPEEFAEDILYFQTGVH